MVAVPQSVTASAALKRISWGAIIAGMVVGLAVQALLGLLGVAIGATVIDPLQEAHPLQGIGMGAGIYAVISAVLAMLAGGFVAGAFACVQSRYERTLHGLATWAAATILLLVLITSGVGSLLSSTLSLVGKGLSLTGQAVAAVAKPVAGEIAQQTQNTNVDLGDLLQQAKQLLRSTGVPALQPDNLKQTAQQISQQAKNTAKQVARNPQAADAQISQLFDRIQREASSTISAADSDALVNVLVTQTDMSREQAQQTVASWQQTYAKAYQKAQNQTAQLKAEAEQKARQAGQATADAVAKAAWWSFILLLLGAIAAAVGANIGDNRVAVVARGSVGR